jgi:hypothetical protein
MGRLRDSFQPLAQATRVKPATSTRCGFNLNEVLVQLLRGVGFVQIGVSFVLIGLGKGSERLVEGAEMFNSAKLVMDLAFENTKLGRLKFIPTNSISGNLNGNKGRGAE